MRSSLGLSSIMLDCCVGRRDEAVIEKVDLDHSRSGLSRVKLSAFLGRCNCTLP